jgi:hypothetical protein
MVVVQCRPKDGRAEMVASVHETEVEAEAEMDRQVKQRGQLWDFWLAYPVEEK